MLLMAGPLACLDATALEFPTAPGPYQTRLFVRECGELHQVWVLAPSDPGPTLVDDCPLGGRYFVAYFASNPADLGLSRGSLELGTCAPDETLKCIETDLPNPEKGHLFSASRSANGALSAWEAATSGWPGEVAALRFRRPTGCPSYHRFSVDQGGYADFTGVFLDDERIVLMGDVDTTAPGAEPAIHLFETTVSQLRDEEPLGDPTAKLEGLRGSSISAHPLTGELLIGISNQAFMLRGPASGELVPVPHRDPARYPALLAIRPVTDSSLDLVVRDARFPDELEFYAGNSWAEPYRDEEPRQMVGTCISPDFQGQRAAIFWINESELIAMPHALRPELRGPVSTSSTAPDGYWHVIDGRPSWRRVPGREEGDCLSVMLLTKDRGLVAVTERLQFLAQQPEGWRAFEVQRFVRGAIDEELRRVTPIEGGFAYTREGKRFGYVVDDVLCQETVLERNELNDIA